MRKLAACLVLMPLWCFPQQDDPKWAVSGYLKDMISLNTGDSSLVDNLIHHRLNLAWFPSENLSGSLELRNRIIFGNTVSAIANYGEFVDVNDDYLDLSVLAIDRNDLVFHTMVDRISLRWNKKDWEVTLGRQRVNWGVNLAWNPNDLFNSYSFFDFDYEERPGSDALRIRKYTGFASEIEWVIKAADNWQSLTTALKYLFNFKNYDIQLIGGVMENNLALGTGWAGNVGNAGFKGELTYLNAFDSGQTGLLISSTIDYSFSNSLYLNGSMLYSSYGTSAPNLFEVSSTPLDIRSISPYRWSTFLQASYPIHPLVNGGLSTIFYPSDESLFLNPFVTYSIRQNLDMDLIGQIFLTEEIDGTYGAASTTLFLRLKWSY